MNHPARFAFPLLLICCLTPFALGQAECIGPSGLRGIRLDGQLMAFTTGVRAVAPDQPVAVQNGQDRLGFGRFTRDGNKQICSGGLFLGRPRFGGGFGPGQRPRSPLDCTTTFEDASPGTVNVHVHLVAHTDMRLTGVYFYIHLPAADFAGEQTDLPNGIAVSGDHRDFALTLADSRHISVYDNRHDRLPTRDLYFPLWTGNLSAAQNVDVNFTLKVTGDVDHSPATITVDPFETGSPFAGIGGNFRIQGPADPAQIQYNLDHLRVVWGRVAMPWNVWQPDENQDPIQAASSGHLDEGVKAAMEMARTLSRKNISMIISDWAAPDWALMPRDPNSPPFRGRRLNQRKWPQICKSIASYLLYMKQNYGAEPRLFSFNESDIGINVLQSPAEHADTIKRLGAYFASQGLTTKMLLGDTGDPTPMHFIDTAMSDPEAVKYIGAVSFHSWRGGTVEQFTRWANAAKQLNVPLLVAEGGTDSNSYAYPALFLEPWYGLGEMAEYVEICRICQPLSILQWQLTNDYSLLTGGHDGLPLKPTQRFWNLTQLDLTPAGSAALPITCDQPAISACAYLDPGTGTCTIHLVNEGPTREATISGFSRFATQVHVYVTDATRSVQELPLLTITQGKATLTLDSQSFTTLMVIP